MAQYRTAQGKMLDMSTFAAQNEKVRAVGNMKVNARGDTIDSNGKVVQSVNNKINEYYNQSVGDGQSAAARALATHQMSGPVNSPAPKQAAPRPAPSELNEIERELEDSMEEDIVIEQEKKARSKK